ncbi:dimethylamine monooxygenase subunit DmmA family protein (plasmid) [Ralstonia sp. 25C]|uniref:dimethylamine monooxygenase subunit DmmA family protein n=1 Tax=Ralstonia sp. 25C TaxID=3447363 RepID=UPI003F74CBC1
MLITGIKSRPVYDVLTPMSNGAMHVLAGQGSGGQALLRLLGELTGKSEQITVFYSAESFSGKDYSTQLRSAAADNLTLFETNAQLVSHLDSYLLTAKTGLRLYLAGSESFIGTAMQVANKFNLNNDEVLREHGGTFVRRVWCVHCDTYTENVTHRVFKCPGCGLDLVVRDHYSRHLAAFMGVKADAEQTGNMPAAEELDT